MKGWYQCDMDELKQLIEINWSYVIISLILLLICTKLVWTLLDWLLFEKLGIETRKMKQRREERELLMNTVKLSQKTASDLEDFQKKHAEDEKQFRDNLNDYIEESRLDRKVIHDEMKEFTNNRNNDRIQSIEIQKELKDSISARDVQINSLVVANKEMLAEKINEKYKYYISIGGIPEDEYDEFVSMHKAYKGLGGNHHGDAKFQYCIDHLTIIPVKTNLVYKEE